MRSTMCDDGNRRIVAKVAVPLGTNEITKYALAHPMFQTAPEKMNEFQRFNKRELFNLVKDYIRSNGDTMPDDEVATVWSESQVSQATEHVKMLFPEVD